LLKNYLQKLEMKFYAMATTENKTVEEIKTTGRQYESIQALMRGEGISKEIQQAVKELERETHLTKQLACMRAAAGLTQEQLAEKLQCSQSCISKWEAGRDEDLEIRTIRAYSDATNQRIGLLIGKPLNHVEAINLHLSAMQRRLLALAALAREHDELESGINAFFAEACLNIFAILAKCQAQMPQSSTGTEVRIEMIDQRQASSKRHSSRTETEQASA
jgi:transcriptional regulator with XRE-family HTH domain